MNKKIKENILGTPTPNKTMVNIRKADLGDPKVTGNIQKLGKDVNVNVVEVEHDVLNPEAVITPQDNATIKYLSNVKDANSGEISQPFNIGDKKYQMVRGMNQDKEVILGVYCFDDMNEAGENIIHSMEYFEENIANPMKEQMGMVGQDIQVVEKENEYDYAAAERDFHDKKEYDDLKRGDFADDDVADDDVADERKVVDGDTYEGFKHYLVNKHTNEVRKFKTIEEILSANKSVDEEYMGGTKFKKYVTEKLFGRRKKMNELDSDPAQEMNLEDAKQLAINVIKALQNNSAISGKLKKVYNSKNVEVKQTLIDYFIKAIGMNPNQIGKYVKTVKDTGKELKAAQAEPTQAEPTQQALTEKKVITKNMLENKVKKIRVIKVKDLQ